MKAGKAILILLLTIAPFTSKAQWFDFADNLRRMEMGMTIGQSGSFTEYAGFGMGGNILVGGFYLDFITADPQHKYSPEHRQVEWHDSKAFSINAGYQIPILSWLRIMPLAGYAQTNEGTTYGDSYSYSEDGSDYHRYVVDPNSRKHYFNYGGGLSIQPLKWFSINIIATRCALYGGVSLDIRSIAQELRQ